MMRLEETESIPEFENNESANLFHSFPISIFKPLNHLFTLHMAAVPGGKAYPGAELILTPPATPGPVLIDESMDSNMLNE